MVTEDLARLPRYVNRWGLSGSPLPVAFRGAATYWFAIDGKLSHLERLCARTFREPSRGRIHYRPISARILILFQDVKAYGSQDPPYSQIGTLPLRLATVMVPVVAMREDGSADHIAWFIPYGFADAMWEVLLDREVAGLPIEAGRVQIPASNAEAVFRVEAVGVDHFSLDARPQGRCLIEVLTQSDPDEEPARTDSVHSTSPKGWASPGAAMEGLRGMLLGRTETLNQDVRGLETLLDSVGLKLPIVSLKQLPDAQDSELVCYQSIVEVPGWVTEFRGATPLSGSASCTLHSCATHPFHRDLGVDGARSALAAVRADLDYAYGAGKTVWRGW